MTETEASPWLRGGIVVAAAVLLLTGLGWLDTSPPDEPRYTQVAEEIRAGEHGGAGWILLHLNGGPYDQKPPLYFWLAATAGMLTDRVTETAARLPSALFGIAAVFGTLLLGTRMFGGRAGALAAALLLTIYEYAKLSRRAQLDVMLTALELLALAGFWWLDRGLAKRSQGAAVFHGAMGLAALTKGPVGFLIPMLSVVAYLGWERRLKDIGRAFPWWAFGLSLGPVAIWYLAAASLAPPGYSEGALVENTLGRFFSGSSHERPFYYFVYNFPLDFLPWTLLWPIVWVVGRREVFAKQHGEQTLRAWRFLLAIVATSFVFFSLSSGKRGLYMLPAFPAAALLCGDAALRWARGRAKPPVGLSSIGAGLALTLGAAGAIVLAIGLGSALVPTSVSDFVTEFDARLLIAYGAAILVTVVGAVVAWGVLLRNRVRVASHFVVVIASVFAIELATFLLLFPAIDSTRSPRAIAVSAAAFTETDETIGVFRDRAMIGGLVYYGRRRVVQLDTKREVKEFFSDGGRVIVAKRRKIEELGRSVKIVSTARSGDRQLVVVVPSDDRAPPALTGTESGPRGAPSAP